MVMIFMKFFYARKRVTLYLQELITYLLLHMMT